MRGSNPVQSLKVERYCQHAPRNSKIRFRGPTCKAHSEIKRIESSDKDCDRSKEGSSGDHNGKCARDGGELPSLAQNYEECIAE